MLDVYCGINPVCSMGNCVFSLEATRCQHFTKSGLCALLSFPAQKIMFLKASIFVELKGKQTEELSRR